jgi:hypothetical protein
MGVQFFVRAKSIFSSSRGSSIMIPQVVTSETVTVISPNGISFPQTDKPQPSHQSQDSLKKHLKAEIKVMAVNSTQNTLGWLEGRGRGSMY